MLNSLNDLSHYVNFFYIAVLILFIIYNVAKKFKIHRSIKRHLPAVYGLPFVGILHQFIPARRFFYVIGSYFNQLNSFTHMTWFANMPLIVTIDPDLIKQLLNSDEFLNKAGVIYGTMDEALPNGIITGKYFKWRHNRKLMNPSFSPQILQQLLTDFNKCSKSISEYLL